MKLLQGDCIDILKTLEDNSIDAIVTDPPYGLVSINKRWSGKEVKNTPGMETKEGSVWARKAKGFMGKEWDGSGIEYNTDMWRECYRVLKPGGYLLAFTGTRTYHKIASAIDDAGFEIRDMIAWCFGQGFPKSLNIGKAVARLQGEYIPKTKGFNVAGQGIGLNPNRELRSDHPNYVKPTFDNEWEGWGTATKPAVEPVSICAKPLTPDIIYAIIGIDLTNKIINLCQKSNVNANDVVSVLKSIQQLLERAGVNSVHENARTLNWENIESALIAAVSFISQGHTLKEKTEENKEVSVQESASQNGKSNLPESSIQIGKVESLNEKMDTLLSILVTNNTDLNTILLWKNILEDTLEKANTFTTEMALKTITAWKTYNSLLSANIQNFTSPNKKISPALEPITVARKPIEGTVAENCLKWGVGGINIDECRVEGLSEKELNWTPQRQHAEQKTYHKGVGGAGIGSEMEMFNKLGRFPANLIHDGSDEVVELFPNTKTGAVKNTVDNGANQPINLGGGLTKERPADSGSAARFFYCAKASRSERNRGLDKLVQVDIMHILSNNTNICEKSSIKEVKLATLLVDMETSQLEGIEGSGTQNKSVLEWSIELFGKNLTEKYQEDFRSIILTETQSITPLKIYKWLIHLLTKEYTADVSLEMESGGNHVVNAENCNTLTITISEKMALALGVKNAQSPTQLKISVKEGRSGHPTVKPISLMEYLVKLVSREGHTVLDPFMGSGTTGIACKKLNRHFIGIEREPEYITIAENRIEAVPKTLF